MSGKEEEIEIRIPRIRLRINAPPEFITALIIAIAASVATGLKAWATATGPFSHGFISDEVYYATIAEKMAVYMFGYVGPIHAPASGIGYSYWNLEHPPLAKYIIALALMAQHSPYAVAWRVPSVILTSLEPLIVFLGITLGNPRDVRRLIGGAVGAMVFPAETITATVGALALLDTYAAFFITLAIAFAVNRRWGLAAIAMGLALASKETALPFVLALAVYYYLNSNEARKDRIITSLAIILGPIAIAALSYAPIVAYLGPKNTLLGIETTLRWDLQNRPSGPVPSSPIDWFFGINSMIGGIITETIKAGNNYIVRQLLLRFSMNPYVEAPAFIIAMGYFIYTLLVRKAVPKDLGTVFLVTGFVIFSIIYIFNHTFYSFYSIVFVPVTAMIWSEVISSVYPGIRSVRRAIGAFLSALAEEAEEGA